VSIDAYEERSCQSKVIHFIRKIFIKITLFISQINLGFYNLKPNKFEIPIAVTVLIEE